MRYNNFVFAGGWYGDYEISVVHFEVSKSDILRATKEYNLAYIPKTKKWFGDVIAYGQWWDLESDEVTRLREAYNLDALMRDYLESEKQQASGTEYNALANS